jgi:hypothetical protein
VLRHAQPQSHAQHRARSSSPTPPTPPAPTASHLMSLLDPGPWNRALASPLPGPPVLAYCIPMPEHDRSTAESQGAPPVHHVMPASRSRLASRCQNVNGHHHRRCTELVPSSP